MRMLDLENVDFNIISIIKFESRDQNVTRQGQKLWRHNLLWYYTYFKEAGLAYFADIQNYNHVD